MCHRRLQTRADKRRGSSSPLLAASPPVTSPADLKRVEGRQKETMTHDDKKSFPNNGLRRMRDSLRCPLVVNTGLSCFSKYYGCVCVELRGGFPGSNYYMRLSCHGDRAHVGDYPCVYKHTTGRNRAKRISNVSPFSSGLPTKCNST